MTTTAINQLSNYGQSFWYDNIQRSLITNGDLENMIKNADLRGVTSNPSIFEKAIAKSNDYDSTLARLAHELPDASSREHFYQLAIEDIKNTADLLLPVYQKSNKVDGYVSLEVSPDLAYKTEETVKEAKELFARIGRPNVMIKVPATAEGVAAVEQLIADGVNVNATLLFSVERYVEIAKAFIRGMEQRKQNGLSVDNISSVASFFVSRVDSSLEPLLQEILAKQSDPALQALSGRIAIINAQCAYIEFQKLFGSTFKALAKAGANPQRLLWASTGIKNPDWSDVLYIESLIGDQTVNTIPPATLEAFMEHGVANSTLEDNIQQAKEQFALLTKAGINVDKVMQALEDQGVASFAQSFDNLLNAIDEKISSFKDKQGSNAA